MSLRCRLGKTGGTMSTDPFKSFTTSMIGRKTRDGFEKTKGEREK